MTAHDSDPADAFSAIGNEHRIAILRALMTAYRDGETPLAYSELMERIDLCDSGQFNYHLQQLTGRFIADRDGGYVLTSSGRKAVSAIASGTLDESASLDPEPVRGSCYACGESTLVLRYPGERVRVSCTSCGEEVVHITFPPSGVTSRTMEELQRDFDRWARHWRSLAVAGVCPECSGRMECRLGREAGTPTVGNVPVRAVLSCEQCWARGFIPPGLLALDHPGVIAFFWTRGIDLRERPLWQLEWALSAEYQTVLSEDPMRVRIEIPAPDATLSITIDESLAVDSMTEHREL